MGRIVDHLKSIKPWVSDRQITEGLKILKVLGIAGLPPYLSPNRGIDTEKVVD